MCTLLPALNVMFVTITVKFDVILMDFSILPLLPALIVMFVTITVIVWCYFDGFSILNFARVKTKLVILYTSVTNRIYITVTSIDALYKSELYVLFLDILHLMRPLSKSAQRADFFMQSRIWVTTINTNNNHNTVLNKHHIKHRRTFIQMQQVCESYVEMKHKCASVQQYGRDIVEVCDKIKPKLTRLWNTDIVWIVMIAPKYVSSTILIVPEIAGHSTRRSSYATPLL